MAGAAGSAERHEQQRSRRKVQIVLKPKSTLLQPEVGRSVGTLFRSYLDVLKELEAENYTMRIAAKRSSENI